MYGATSEKGIRAMSEAEALMEIAAMLDDLWWAIIIAACIIGMNMPGESE